MQKIDYTYGENDVYTGQNISGDGTSENPLGYSGGVEHVDPRTLLWETSGNMYNQNFRLSEPATHYDKLMIYSSGAEYVDRGVNLGKNVYKTQNTRMGCDACGYSPWRLDFSANYMLGCDIKIEGDSGHVGSAYYIGIGSNNATYAAGKWVGDNAPKMLQPYKIYGLDHKPWHTVTVLEAENGSASASLNSGCEYDKVTLTSTPDDGWYSMGYNVSGATLSGNQFMIEDEDVTVQPLFTDQGYPITYLTDGHGTLTGPEIAIPGQEVELSAQYNDYYRFNNYEVSGGTISGNKLLATGPCTVKANFKLNSFVASGGTAAGSNTYYNRNNSDWTPYNIGPKYFTRSYSTSNVPSSWYSNSNRWHPTGDISGYSITMNGKIGFYSDKPCEKANQQITACILAGSTHYQQSTVQCGQTGGASLGVVWSKTQTVSTYNCDYGVSAKLYLGKSSYTSKTIGCTYSASVTNGTWKATGVIK